MASSAQRALSAEAAQGDDRDLGRAAADIHNHVAHRVGHRQAGPDGRSHGLINDLALVGAGLAGGVFHGAALDFGDARRHPHDHARVRKPALRLDLADEMPQHGLGDVEVGDDAVAQGAHGRDARRSPPYHPLGVLPHRQDFIGDGVHGHHRGLAQQDAPPADVHQGIGRAQVNAQVRREAGEPVHHMARDPFHGGAMVGTDTDEPSCFHVHLTGPPTSARVCSSRARGSPTTFRTDPMTSATKAPPPDWIP
jgi:hypothetical protein